ncbi:fibulin-1 isoform X3 [Pimephales promelas]|uniref:fibulin-1 isoform X3 n=1 Tax=Pimephales promelas TaxID=90988 RepID=UPI001955750B|nr:fibulin-1 isoform X3 [Pimephales promelas]KAG1938364.1 fibulin-2 [Pimephales promelas]
MDLCVIVLLLSLCGLLRGQDPISLDDCCKDGKDRGQESQDCTSLPLISESTTCRIAQEQCCATVLDDNICTIGINMAKDQGSCDSLLSTSTCETKTSKMCCECCLLGRAAQERGLSCDLTFAVGYQCGVVSRACCVDRLPNTHAKPTPDAQPDASNTDDRCKDAGCVNGLCVNGTCVCLAGYKLKADRKTCEDINECLLGAHQCRPGERCINTLGSYRCQREVSCGTGYELTDSNQCEDIDECETGTHNCGAEMLCQNSVGSFRCRPRMQCGEGFIQDALGSCIDINECLSVTGPCPAGHMCFNTVGSFTCQRQSVNCGRGYHLNAQGTRCVDIDECAGPDNSCDGHGCINLLGSYRCECRSGFVFNSITRSCEDINECRNYPGRLCAHKCENILGSYKCSCTTGFKLASDARNCDDLDECESAPCSQECANVYGSYQCYCRRGYQLSDVDGITCEDIDECALPTGGHICSYRCYNTPGSFHCTCPATGYTLAPNGRSCQDIDECVTGTHACTESQSCFNIQGGYKCLSFDCPANYRRSGDTRCERLPCNLTSECLALPVRITYYHLTFPTKIPIPTNIFRMGPSNSALGDDIEVAIVDGNQGGFFSAKRVDHGGVLVVQKPITLPQDFEISLEMKLRRFGHLSVYLFKIRLFVTPDEPSNAITE